MGTVSPTLRIMHKLFLTSIFYVCSFMAAFAFILPTVVSANTVLRTGDSISVSDEQIVEGDFYTLGSNVSVSGTVTEDFYNISESLTTNGSIGADLFAVAREVQMHASVTDDVRILGIDVTIAERINGDLVVIGGELKVLSTASIGGDVLFFGDKATIDGDVGGSVMGFSNQLRLDARVEGDVDVKTGTLTVGERAVIIGDVRLESLNKLVRAQGATIEGDLVENTATQEDFRSHLRDFLVPFMISLFANLTLYLLFRQQVELLIAGTYDRYGINTLIGLSVLIVSPFLAILLMVSILGLFVGIMGILVYLLASLMAFVLAQVILGAVIFRSLKRSQVLTPVSIIVGTVLFHVIAVIPYVGGLLVLLMVALTLGAISNLVYRKLR